MYAFVCSSCRENSTKARRHSLYHFLLPPHSLPLFISARKLWSPSSYSFVPPSVPSSYLHPSVCVSLPANCLSHQWHLHPPSSQQSYVKLRVDSIWKWHWMTVESNEYGDLQCPFLRIVSILETNIKLCCHMCWSSSPNTGILLHLHCNFHHHRRQRSVAV